MRVLLLTTSLFVFSFITNPAAAADVLIMENGDRLSGKVLFRSPKTIRFQTDYGVLYVPSAKVSSVESATYQMVDLVGQRAVVEEPTPTPSITPAPVEMAAEPVEDPKDKTGLWGARWSGEINAGAELQTGNSDSETLTLDGETSANWDDIHRLTIGADYEREEENDVKVEDDREVYGAYDYFFAEKWFWNNTASFRQDKVDDLDSRIEATSGLGYQFYDRDDLSLEVTFGPGYQREKYEGQDADSNMTANWTADYEQSFYDDFVRLFHNHDWTTPTDEFSSWLFESETGVKVPLKAGIVATGEIDFDWNNNPPAGVEEDDTTYRLKLGYEWP